MGRVPPAVAARLTLMALGVLVFWPAVLGGFVWDDHSLIVNNLRLQQPG